MRTEFEEELEHELARLAPAHEAGWAREYETVKGRAKVTPKPATIKKPAAPPAPSCRYSISDAVQLEREAARKTLELSGQVAKGFTTSVGALSARGRFTSTVLDNKYWFAKLYELITFYEIGAIKSFRYPAFVLHFIPIFYDLYYQAIQQFSKGERDRIAPHWANHFRVAGRPKRGASAGDWVAEVQASIVSGVSAHIKGDMAPALEQAYRSYTAKYCLSAVPFDAFREDFFDRNRPVFDRVKGEFFLELSNMGPFPVSPEIGQFIIGKGEQALGGGLDIDEVYRWRAKAWEVAGGRVSGAAPSREADFDTPPPSPAKCSIICFEHFHIPKTTDPKKPGHFTSGALTLLSPVNPGFIDSSDDLVTDTSSTGLQTCLKKLITTKFPEFLSRASRAGGTPSSQDRLHVALVDLTGDKLSKPEFAGWGSTVAMYGASAPKVLPLYAAFQLRADLRQMASKNKLSKGTALEAFALKEWKQKKLWRDFPDLNWLFHIRLWSGDPDTLDFTSDARTVFDKINENPDASELIRAVGFPYIASVAWQSGLRHPARGGLWLTNAYDRKAGWADQPSLKASAFIHNLTALSAATYFTLLAQGRLVDDSSSAEIKKVLQFGCHSCLFPLVIGLDTAIGLQASKCGIYKPYIHDCVLVERPEVRYAAAILSELDATWPGWPDAPKCPTGKETGRYTELVRALDSLMVQNNKSPKPPCG